MEEQKIYSPNDLARAMALSQIYYENLSKLQAFQINEQTAFRLFTKERVRKWVVSGKLKFTQNGKGASKMYETSKLIELALRNDHSMTYIKLK